jgi:hypothetical protein
MDTRVLALLARLRRLALAVARSLVALHSRRVLRADEGELQPVDLLA